MRKIIILLLAAGSVFAGCASLDSIKDISAVNPLGIVSVKSNSDITWYGEEKQSSGGLINLFIDNAVEKANNEDLSKLLSRTDFLIDDVTDMLNAKLASLSSVEVVSKEVIVSSTAYKNATEDALTDMSTDVVKADGYKFVSIKDKAFTASINKEIGLQAMVFINFDLKKKMMGGMGKNGEMGAVVTMTVTIVDPAGEWLFNKSYYGQSKDTIRVIGGVYDADRFIELYKPVINKISDKFLAEF